MTKNCDVLVIGFDALDQEIVRRWAADGLMPSFAALQEKSCWGLIENQPGLQAGSAWPTFYRGVSVARHGQLDGVRQFNPRTYELETNVGEDHFDHELIWRRLSNEGRRVAVVDAPYTYLSKDLNGIEVHDWGNHVPIGGDHSGTPGPLTSTTTPPELADELIGRFGRDPLGGKLCDFLAPRSAVEIIDFREKLTDRLQKKAEMSAYLLKKGGWDFFLTTFSEAHCVGHQCWHLHDTSRPEHDADMVARLGDPLKDIYQALDTALGRILREVDQDETTVIVYCSHGIEPSVSGTYLLDKLLMKIGGGELKDKSKGAEGLMRRSWRSLPAGLQKHLQPFKQQVWHTVVGTAMQGHWPERRFFEIFANNSTGGVRLNVKGREAKGVIDPGAEYDATLDELIKELEDIVNLDTGKPLVSKCTKTRDIYSGENIDKLPDLLVDWNKQHGTGEIRRVYSPKIGTIEHDSPPARTGDHGMAPGMFLACGPKVLPGHRNDAVSVTDLAPTFAALLGCSLWDFDGKPIEQVCGQSERMASAGG